MRYFIMTVLLVLGGCVSQPLPDGFKAADDFNPVEAAKTRISLGLTYLKNGNYSQAKFNLDKALQFAPRLADAHYSMAYYYQVVGEDDMAEQAYQEALDFAPSNPDIANTYGAFLCQKGKYEKAKRFFLMAVNNTNYVSAAETYENLALCSESQGQVEDAITYLQQAINHQPSRGRSLLMITRLLASQARWEEAKTALKRYEKTARVTPDTLWLSYEIEKELGNNAIAVGYGDMLVRMYPNHKNTKQYLLQRYRKVPRAPEAIEPSQTITQSDAEAKTTEAVAPEPDAVVEEQAVERSDNAPDIDLAVASTVNKNQQEEVQNANLPVDGTVSSEDNSEVAAAEEMQQAEDVAEMSGDTVPDVSSDSGQSESQEPIEQSQESENKKETIVTHHVVLPGENLYRISLLYNVKMNRLIEWNQLQDASSIFIGKKLVVVDPQTIE